VSYSGGDEGVIEDGKWKMEDGRWKMENGRCKIGRDEGREQSDINGLWSFETAEPAKERHAKDAKFFLTWRGFQRS
jgi:hypothetical protein